MKKFILFLLLFSSGLFLSSCDNNHEEHNYSYQIVDSSYHKVVCNGCDYEQTECHIWDLGKVTIEPTEQEEGVKTFTCTECQYKRDDRISKLNHEHSWIDATCTSPKKCSTCNATEGNSLSHEPDEAVEEIKVVASCEEVGLYELVVYCVRCGEELSRETKTLEKLSHTEEVLEGKAATCTETGLTDGKKCGVCGEVLLAQEEIEALGHTGGASTETELAKCEICGESYGDLLTTYLGTVGDLHAYGVISDNLLTFEYTTENTEEFQISQFIMFEDGVVYEVRFKKDWVGIYNWNTSSWELWKTKVRKPTYTYENETTIITQSTDLTYFLDLGVDISNPRILLAKNISESYLLYNDSNALTFNDKEGWLLINSQKHTFTFTKEVAKINEVFLGTFGASDVSAYASLNANTLTMCYIVEATKSVGEINQFFIFDNDVVYEVRFNQSGWTGVWNWGTSKFENWNNKISIPTYKTIYDLYIMTQVIDLSYFTNLGLDVTSIRFNAGENLRGETHLLHNGKRLDFNNHSTWVNLSTLLVEDEANQNDSLNPDEPAIDSEVNEGMFIASRKTFKLLTIGDSLSSDSINLISQILKGFGVENIIIASLTVNNCSIEDHLSYMTNDESVYSYKKIINGLSSNASGFRASKAFKDEEWQYIILQQSADLSGDVNSYEEFIETIYEYVLSYNKNVKIGWHMTWAYGKNVNIDGFAKYENDQDKMYLSIIDAVKTNIENVDYFDFIIPSATAIQNARTSYLGETITINGINLEELGQLIIGLTYVLEITHWPIADLNLDLISQKYIPYFDVVKEATLNSLKNPYKVTTSIYLSNPVVNREKVEYEVEKDVQYSDISNMCKLDMYLPKNESFDIIIHFHGGGLNSGTKDDDAHIEMAKTVASAGIGFVSVNYRLYPEAKYPDFFVDGANAIKYVIDYLDANNINGKVHISGQSAGAYLSMMLCFNNAYLESVGLSVTDIDGWIIEAGQPTTHFNVLGEKGEDTQLQRVDEAAPLYYVNNETKFNDMLLITYTNDIALRLEQNTLLYKTILNYNAAASIDFRIYEGEHCENSLTAYRNHYVHADIMIDYVKSRYIGG